MIDIVCSNECEKCEDDSCEKRPIDAAAIAPGNQHVADNAGWNQHQPHEPGPVRLEISDGVRVATPQYDVARVSCARSQAFRRYVRAGVLLPPSTVAIGNRRCF